MLGPAQGTLSRYRRLLIIQEEHRVAPQGESLQHGQHASLSHLQALQRLDHGDGSFFPCHQTLSLRHDQHAGLYQDNMFCYVSGGEMMKSVPVPIWGILALVPDPSKLFSQIRNRNFKTWIRTANCCQSFYEHDQ